MATIDISCMGSEIMQALDDFNDDINKKVEMLVDDVAKDTVAMLKASSPVGKAGSPRRGSYRDGWGIVHKRKCVRGIAHVVTAVVRNRTDWQLTHLLEKGHADIRHGGRVDPIVHIAPAEEMAREKMMEGVKKL